MTIVWTGNNPYRGWENEFWNRSVKHAYDLGPDALIAGPTEPHLTVQASTGLLRDPTGKPVHAQYVLADPSAQILGTRVAADDARAMVLYRVDGLLRTATAITGWLGDNWTQPTVTWLRRGCPGGVLRVPVHSDPTLYPGVTQRIAVSGTTTPVVVRLPSTATKTIVVPLTSQAGICHVRFQITPSRRPADYPALNNPDPRTLGVLISGFEYVPASG